MKIRPQAKIDNFAFKYSNIIIEGVIWKKKKFHEKSLKHKKIFILAQTYFLIASSEIFKNDAILINHGSFF